MPDSFAQLSGLAHWRVVDFISDLHLQASEPATFDILCRWLARPVAERANALIILGDLFEVWIGDDALQGEGPEAGFWRRCAAALRAHSRDTPTWFMAGNRDFLLGEAGLRACGLLRLEDPTVLTFCGQRWLLSHGDALCLGDIDYQRFRLHVRNPAWQRDFLSRPLAERQAIARELRQQSDTLKRQRNLSAAAWVDVDASAVFAWLDAARATTLIHGHTHQPITHDLGSGLQRVVLSDWDATSTPPRLEVLRLSADGVKRYPVLSHFPLTATPTGAS